MPTNHQFPRTIEIVREGIANKLHLGMQVYVSQAGNVIGDFAIGMNREDEVLTPETLCSWLSSGKPITAAAVFQFIENGKLSVNDRVSSIIPEFAARGKEEVTVAHLLTHTGGLRPVSSGWPHKSWDEIVAKTSNTPLRKDWTPGENAAYDPALSWFILGEILQRLEGKPIDQIVRQNILEPLDMVDCWMVVPKHLYLAYGDRIGVLHTIVDQEFRPTQGHEEVACRSASPGGSMRGPISQLGNFYEMMLQGGVSRSGRQILSPESISQMTSRQRVGMFDLTFQHKLDFGYGVIVNSNRYGAETVPYGFGRYASDDSFGHGGAQSSIGFADPEHQLVVAAVANGCPGEKLHNERFRELNSAIYEDLGLSDSNSEG